MVHASLNIIITNQDLKIEDRKAIELFRPDIEIYKESVEIEIEVRNQDQIEIRNKIKVDNKGKGTAVLNLEVDESSQIKKFNQSEILEFLNNFWTDLKFDLESLKPKYEEFSEIIDNFIKIGDKPISLVAENRDNLKITFEKLEDALHRNSLFRAEFVGFCTTAYMRNISIITEFRSFLNYIKSIYNKKILLIDPTQILKISEGNQILNAKLTITDVMNNEYPPVELSNIKIKSNKECEVPIHLFFEFL